mmetsp:Transcript_15360/g.31876  ORF Transcript_15360/g.31876 Transcript_15360/m.31876 type:complete len:425 (+) Transcript_15360:978-2252(+)
MRLCEYTIEQRLQGRRLPVAVQLDLEGCSLDRLYELRDEGEGQPEVGNDRPRLVVAGEVGGARGDGKARDHHRCPNPDSDGDDLRLVTRRHLVYVDGGLRQCEAARCLEHHGHVLHWLLALQGDIKANRALHHQAVHAPHGIIGIGVILLTRVENLGHLGLDQQLLLRLPRALAVGLPDDAEEVLVFLLHLIVVQLLHLRVHKTRCGWVGAEVADLHLAVSVHRDDHPLDPTYGLDKGLHRDHGMKPRAPDKLHLLEHHEVPSVSAHDQVGHRRRVGRLRRQLVAQTSAYRVLAKPLLEANPATLLHREDGVLAHNKDLLLARRKGAAEARHLDVGSMLTDVRGPVHLHLLAGSAFASRLLVDVIGRGSEDVIAVGLDAHRVVADDEGVYLRHVADRARQQEGRREHTAEGEGVLLEDGEHAVQ